MSLSDLTDKVAVIIHYCRDTVEQLGHYCQLIRLQAAGQTRDSE